MPGTTKSLLRVRTGGKLIPWAAAVAIVIATAAALGLWARHGAASTSGETRKTVSQITVEYRREAAGLALAPGWGWPMNPGFPSTGPDGALMTYETGYGRTRADTFWFCSWATAYLSSQKSSPAHTQAATQMAGVLTTFFYKVALVPSDRPQFASMLTRAFKGSTASLNTHVRLNCPHLTSGAGK
jgi:hypothetical protein